MMAEQRRAWQLNQIRTGPRGGVPVVLVHALGFDLTYWGSQIEALCDGYDVVAYDLPGQGRSPGTPGDWTMDQAVSGLAQVVRSTGSHNAHIVGVSVGGLISQVFAIAEPELVRSLSLIATTPTFSESGRKAIRERAQAVCEGGMAAVLEPSLKRWFADSTRARRPDLMDRITKTLLSDDPLVHQAMWEMVAGFEVAAAIRTIAQPTLILAGELDASTPPAAAELMHERIAGSELYTLPGAAHMLPLEAPEGVNEHLKRFLARVAG